MGIGTALVICNLPITSVSTSKQADYEAECLNNWATTG